MDALPLVRFRLQTADGSRWWRADCDWTQPAPNLLRLSVDAIVLTAAHTFSGSNFWTHNLLKARAPKAFFSESESISSRVGSTRVMRVESTLTLNSPWARSRPMIWACASFLIAVAALIASSAFSITSI
jgi:hypothetical protein